jgi:hypothetical protein
MIIRSPLRSIAIGSLAAICALALIVLSSAYLTFVGPTQQTASFSLSSLLPNFAVGTVVNGDEAYPAAGPFNASGAGTFSSNPGPSAVPQPATLLSTLGGGFILLRLFGGRKLRIPGAAPGQATTPHTY